MEVVRQEAVSGTVTTGGEVGQAGSLLGMEDPYPTDKHTLPRSWKDPERVFLCAPGGT